MNDQARFLVHGIRNPQSFSEESGEEELWQRITRVLLSDWPKPTTSESTRLAEAGLKIDGDPYYFYAMRTHQTFGYVVFLLDEVESGPVMEPQTMGATPFDSGGLWMGKIHPINNHMQKVNLFAEEDTPLASWQSNFLNYVGRNYSDATEYILGKPPKFGTTPISNSSDLNAERAWTWEVRYPYQLIADRLQIRRAYMHPDQCKDYLDWLPYSNLDDIVSLSLRSWVKANVEVCDVQDLPIVKAEAALVEFIQ